MKKHRLFNFKNIPMDIARLVCSILLPIFRVKRLTPDGKKYKNKISGGAIIASNHASYLDPFIVGVTFWYRRMHMLVAEVVMRNKLLSILIKGVGGIRIDRQCADINSINKAIEKLKAGYLLTIFPQGGIDRQDEIDSIKSGAVLMAFRAGVPIVPMNIVPRKHWYSRQVVIVGETINPKDFCTKKLPSTTDIKTVTEALMNELNRCKAANNTINGGKP